MKRKWKINCLFYAAAILLAASSGVIAQLETATLSGTVTDERGAVLQVATVKITDGACN